MRIVAQATAAPPRAPGGTAAAAPETPSRVAHLLARLRTRYALGIGLITLAGLVIRVVALDHQALWRDEAFTELVSRRSWLDMYAAVRSDSAPPLSYVLTHIAASLSSSTYAIRVPAALAGTAVIPLGAALGRRLGQSAGARPRVGGEDGGLGPASTRGASPPGDRTGVAAALVCALIPALVLPSRDARMYALAGALVLAMVLTLWRAIEEPTRARLTVHAVVVAAAMLTDYFAAFAVVASLLGAAIALRAERQTFARVVGATAAGCAALALWLPFATAQLHHASEPFWVPGIGGDSTLGVLTQFLAGPAVDPDLPQRSTTILLQALCLVGASIGGALVLFLVPWDPPWRRRAIAFLFTAGFGAAVLMLLVSTVHPILDARYVSVVWTPLFPLVGLGISRLRWAAIVPLAAMGAATYALCVWPTRADVATLVDGHLNGRVGVNDTVLVSPDTYLQVLVYGDATTVSRTHVIGTSLPWYWGVAAFPPGAVLDSIPKGTERIDVVTQPGDGQPSIPAGYSAAQHACETRVCLTVYVPNQPAP